MLLKILWLIVKGLIWFAFVHTFIWGQYALTKHDLPPVLWWSGGINILLLFGFMGWAAALDDKAAKGRPPARPVWQPSTGFPVAADIEKQFLLNEAYSEIHSQVNIQQVHPLIKATRRKYLFIIFLIILAWSLLWIFCLLLGKDSIWIPSVTALPAVYSIIAIVLSNPDSFKNVAPSNNPIATLDRCRLALTSGLYDKTLKKEKYIRLYASSIDSLLADSQFDDFVNKRHSEGREVASMIKRLRNDSDYAPSVAGKATIYLVTQSERIRTYILANFVNLGVGTANGLTVIMESKTLVLYGGKWYIVNPEFAPEVMP